MAYADLLLDLPPLHDSFQELEWTRETSLVYTSLPALSPDIPMILLALNSIHSKAVGPDCISVQQLKSSPTVLERLLAIYKASLRDCHVPRALKAVRITPILKCNQPTLLSHMQPIAVSEAVLKILEKYAATYLGEYAERTEVFHDNQYGFRAELGIDMAILHLLEFIRSGLTRDS